MKAKKLLTVLLTALLVLAILPMNILAAQRNVAAGSTASITVENALENDVLAAYKVVDITYNAGNNTLSYAWNSDFADYFPAQPRTTQQHIPLMILRRSHLIPIL